MEVNNKPTESVEANDELKQTAEDLSQPVAEVPVTVEESSNSVDTEKAFDGTESKLSGDIQATSATKATNPIKEVVGEVTDEFENMTIFGNKSLAELHKIQAGQSHLSAGITLCSYCP